MLIAFIFLQIVSQGYFVNPSSTPYGIITTNDYGSALYLIDNKIEILISAPGCGNYFTISPDKKSIGFKLITKDGLQIPAVYDLERQEVVKLYDPVNYAGQVSFSDDGSIAFTVGKELIIKKGNNIKKYKLAAYSNLTPISPDGKYIVRSDGNDNLWILNLETLEQKCISEPGRFRPMWSPNSQGFVYSSLNGCINVYELNSEKTYKIGKGSSPKWSPDGQYIIYYITETDGHELINSDLYLSRYDGSEKIKLTDTDDVFEMDPKFCNDNKKIIFHTYDKREICLGKISDRKFKRIETVIRINKPLSIDCLKICDKSAGRDSIDVPYLHQVYDVPDWFDGHWACAPTTAMMAIAYYRKLPYWDCSCSWPYQHTSHYGRYICERYYYRETNYNLQAQDPSNNWAMGGYGYMWSGTNRPYTHMAQYITNHNITSWRDDNPTWSEAAGEVNAGYPYGMCVGLTASGHLVLAVGVALQGTLICNDPYGNKNTPGYPSYDGKYARYDWPGYNNGYENLNNVYWCVGARGSWEPATDTLVDDLQFGDGFHLHTDPPSSMAYWWDALTGYNNHTWWTYTTAASSSDTCYVIWTPVLPQGGNYEVFVYIPNSNATATAAQYKIYYATGVDTVVINQSNHSNEWVSLGVYPFDTTGSYVYLGDATGTQGQYIAFDAVRWNFVGHKVEEEPEYGFANLVRLKSKFIKNNLSLEINLAVEEDIIIKVYEISGRCRYSADKRKLSSGKHKINISTSDLATGIYIIKSTVGCETFLDKFIRLK